MARRVLHDTFFKQAKAEGYLARSAYKLVQIQESRKVIRAGDRVLDLGCAPGAWMQVAAELVGPRGAVVGIDLQPVLHVFPASPRVTHLVGDIYKTPAEALLAPLSDSVPSLIPATPGASDPAPAPKSSRDDASVSVSPAQHKPRTALFDAVLSDMAPNTTGHGDHERSVALCDHVLLMLPALLKRGGSCTMKVFEGSDYARLLRDTSRLFQQCKGFKPEASRSVSREMYIVATGFQGRQVR